MTAVRTRIAELVRPEIDHLAARCGAGERGACDKLVAIAKTDIDEVRRLAAGRISDQAVLAELARSEKEEIAVAAINRITDLAVLTTIVNRSAKEEVHKAAVARWTALALQEVERLGPQCNVNHQQACQRMLALAKAYPSESATLSIVGRIDNQAVLADIAMTEIRWGVCSICAAAVRKITDQVLLARVAGKDWCPQSLEVMQRLTDQTVLV